MTIHNSKFCIDENGWNHWWFDCADRKNIRISYATMCGIACYVYPDYLRLDSEIEHDKEAIKELQNRINFIETVIIPEIEKTITSNTQVYNYEVASWERLKNKNLIALNTFNPAIEIQRQNVLAFQKRIDNFTEAEIKNASSIEKKKSEYAIIEEKVRDENRQNEELKNKLQLAQEAGLQQDVTLSLQDHKILELEERIKTIAAEHKKLVEQLNSGFEIKSRQFRDDKTQFMKSYSQTQKNISELTKTLPNITNSSRSNTPYSSDNEG
ncbi:MAG: hypothetical protein H0U49_08040 [Parachlamydiaceae bacterium]|nr:hypothetical protein [Parachlamydiaceae bacterium]